MVVSDHLPGQLALRVGHVVVDDVEIALGDRPGAASDHLHPIRSSLAESRLCQRVAACRIVLIGEPPDSGTGRAAGHLAISSFFGARSSKRWRAFSSAGNRYRETTLVTS